MMNKKPRQRVRQGRLCLRLASKEFVDEVHAYAERHKTTITEIIESYLNGLLQKEKHVVVEAEQL